MSESNTIIIESNRTAAYSELEDQRIHSGTNIFVPETPFPNHTWSTHIPNGLEINPGDRISLEGAQIQQVGSGSDVIEFTGFTGYVNDGKKISDNSTKMKVGYYVINNQEFNFNAPKAGMQINLDYRKNGYGGPAFYGFSIDLTGPTHFIPPTDQESWGAFNKGYPYQFIEGSISTFNVATKEWENAPPDSEAFPSASDLLPSHSKGGNSVILTDSTKMYIGPKDYLGPFYLDTITDYIDVGTAGETGGQYKPNFLFDGASIEPFQKGFWDYYSTEVMLTQEPGFVNPSALASNLTALLHQRDGTASAWEVEEYEPMRVDITSEGLGSSAAQNFNKVPIPGVTGETYKTLPTSTGKPLYAFLYGKDVQDRTGGQGTPEDQLNSWYSELQVGNEPANLHVGDGYKPYQGLKVFYSHELTSRPTYMKSMSRLIQTSQRKPMSEYVNNPDQGQLDWEYFSSHFYLHTGPGKLARQTYGIPPEEESLIYLIGAVGNHIVLLDNLSFTTETHFPYFSNIFLQARDQVILETNMLHIVRGYVVGTNMIWNTVMLDLLGEIYSEYFEVVSDTTNTDSSSQEFIDAHAIRLNIGRLDDQISIPATPVDILSNNIPTSAWKSQYLPSPYNIVRNLPAAQPPYGGINQQPWGYRPVLNTDYTTASQWNTALRPALMGGWYGEENEIMMELIMPKEYTALKAYNGDLPGTGLDIQPSLEAPRLLTSSPAVLVPHMTFETYKTNIWDKIPTLANGAKLAIIPLFFKTQVLGSNHLGANSSQMPYVGYIMRGVPEGHKQSIPVPSVGEFFGFSPSLLTTGSGQLASTQKVLRDAPYPTPGILSAGGILTQQLEQVAQSYGWRVGDVGQVIPIVEVAPLGGQGATFRVKTMANLGNPPGQPTPAIVDIIDMGGGYETYSSTGRFYNCTGIGDDFTMRVLTVNNDVNIGGGNASAYINVQPTIYYPYLNVGAEDPAIIFDGQSSKFALKQFHTPKCKGNGIFQRAAYPLNTADPEQHIIEVAPRSAAICGTVSTGNVNHGSAQYEPVYFREILPKILDHPTRSAQSGIAILEIQPVYNTALPSSVEESNFILTTENMPLYIDTLFSKMGFLFEQLLPVYGQPSNDFNRGVYNKSLGFGAGINLLDKYKNMVKPFTTNAYIDATIAFSLSKLIGRTFDPQDEFNTPLYEIIPAFNLGGMPDANVGITNAVSDLLVSGDLAKKLAFPYLVVYSNIINNVEYYGGPQGNSKLPAIAWISRSYATGDYFFSTATDWSFVSDSHYNISEIITDIRLPSGAAAPIDGGSSIIYKIIKPKPMPAPPPSVADQKKEAVAIAKEVKEKFK